MYLPAPAMAQNGPLDDARQMVPRSPGPSSESQGALWECCQPQKPIGLGKVIYLMDHSVKVNYLLQIFFYWGRWFGGGLQPMKRHQEKYIQPLFEFLLDAVAGKRDL